MTAILLAVAVTLADQLAKSAAVGLLTYGESVPVLPGVLYMTYLRNFGAAFGMFYRQSLLMLGAMGVLIVVLVVFRRDIADLGKGAVCAAGIVLGGALGNFIDRIRLGYVIDFIDVCFWPVFNLADMAIVMGTCWLVWAVLRSERR